MPKALENKLQTEAQSKGFKKGSKRYNAYVYGTMNKLGMLDHNHAGNLGPDKLLKHGGLKDGEGMNPHVNGAHIAIVIGLILVIWYFIFGMPGRGFSWFRQSGMGSPAQVNSFVPTEPYPPYASLTGWYEYQYNALGATARATYGEAN